MKFLSSDLMKPHLHTHSLIPENQESPIHFLRDWITPEKYLYRRNHFDYPMLPAGEVYLPITGKVQRPLNFHYSYLKGLPSRVVPMVLECAGNRRSYFRPRTFGEQWKDGGISQGIWRGVPLRDLLRMTGIEDNAVEVVFYAYDSGARTDMEGNIPYARSLPMEKAMHPDTIIAYELNGKPIPYEHGYPLRLIVPQWYGMASVKWLKHIEVINHQFKGPFQAVDYVYYPNKEDDIGKKPVTTIKIDSIIQQPTDYKVLDTGIHEIAGIAWSGEGIITEVELSFDQGKTWEKAKLNQDSNAPYTWTFWRYNWNASEKGEYIIMSRAKDSAGNLQPPEAEWNRKGYGYNAIYSTHVKIE
jgi:DMSO/TMAO reductase YedYZ molybdopterin-dependent catalytic subunit